MKLKTPTLKKINQTLSPEEAISVLNEFDRLVMKKKDYFIGYPMNGNIDLTPFFRWWAQSIASHSPMNDVGNPYDDLPKMINARPFELNILEIFSDLLKFPADESWGYITTGGTLGNEQGLLMGREVLKKFGSPILYFSEDSHFSVPSLAKLLSLDYKLIRSLPKRRNGLSRL